MAQQIAEESARQEEQDDPLTGQVDPVLVLCGHHVGNLAREAVVGQPLQQDDEKDQAESGEHPFPHRAIHLGEGAGAILPH